MILLLTAFDSHPPIRIARTTKQLPRQQLMHLFVSLHCVERGGCAGIEPCKFSTTKPSVAHTVSPSAPRATLSIGMIGSIEDFTTAKLKMVILFVAFAASAATAAATAA